MRLARGALLWERIWPAVWPLCRGARRVCGCRVVRPAAGDCRASRTPRCWRCSGLPSLRRWPGGAARSRRATARRRRSATPHRAIERAARTARCRRSPTIRARPLDGEMAALWVAHQRRMEAAVRRLRVGWPAAGLGAARPVGHALGADDPAAARRDRCRCADWRDRMVRAFLPSFDGSPAARWRASFDLWVTPPEYTGLAPQFLRAGHSRDRAGADRQHAARHRCMAAVRVPRLAIDGDKPGFHRDRQAEFPGRGDADRRQGAEPAPGRRHARALADRDRPGQSAEDRVRASRRGHAARRVAPGLPGQRRLRRRERQGGDPRARAKSADATRRSSSNCRCPGCT